MSPKEGTALLYVLELTDLSSFKAAFKFSRRWTVLFCQLQIWYGKTLLLMPITLFHTTWATAKNRASSS